MTDAPDPLTLAELVRRLGEYEYWLGYDPPGTYVVVPMDEDSPVRCGTGSTPWEAANDAMPKRQVAPRDEAAELRAQVSRLQEALAFAQSVIKSGEEWSPTCDEIIGGALAASEGQP